MKNDLEDNPQVVIRRTNGGSTSDVQVAEHSDSVKAGLIILTALYSYLYKASPL